MNLAEASCEPLVSIIIANYNGRELLRNCLESIYQHPCRYAFEILVVDDHSHDGSFEMVKSSFPEVRVYRNERNLHYASSNNRMFDVARGKYLYLLNSDTLMLENALDRMVDFLEANPRVGCVGSKLLNEDGSVQASVKSLPNFASALWGSRSPLFKLFPNNPYSRAELLHLSADMSSPFTAGYVSSASWLMPKAIVSQVGYLDPRLSYHVDADYCARIWKAEWDVYYLPDAVVIHLDHKGGTLFNPRRRLKAVIEFHRGTWIFFRRHVMKSWWHPQTLFVVVGVTLRFVVSLVLQQLGEVKRGLRARRERRAEAGPTLN